MDAFEVPEVHEHESHASVASSVDEQCMSHVGNVEDITVVATLILGFVLNEINSLYNARWVFKAHGHKEEDKPLYYMWAFAAAMCFTAIIISILNKRYMKLKPPLAPVNGIVKFFSALARNGLFLGTSLSLVATSIHIQSNELLLGSIVLTVIFAVIISIYRGFYKNKCQTSTYTYSSLLESS